MTMEFTSAGMKEATFLCSRTSGNVGSLTPYFFTCEKVIFVGLLTSVCGLCWRQGLVLLDTRVRRLWNGLWFENGPKYLRNTVVPQWTNAKEDLLWSLMLSHIEKWGHRLILMYISYYTVSFFVIYAYFEWLIKQNRSSRTCCPPCIDRQVTLFTKCLNLANKK